MIKATDLLDHSIVMSIGSWSKGIEPELRFWNNWLALKGAEWSYEFDDRLSTDKNIDGKLAIILSVNQGINRILDVGSGPITAVNKKFFDRNIEVEATDALADFYDTLLQNHSIVPPVRTKFSTAEDLSLFYEDSSFDLVHCRNALDHSFNPIRAINEMLRVLRVGGLIVLDHHVNEAEREGYQGFHQFNFSEDNGNFVIWNMNGRTDVSKAFIGQAKTEVELSNDNIFVKMKKTSEFSDVGESSRHRDRAAVLLNSLVSFYGHEALRRINNTNGGKV